MCEKCDKLYLVKKNQKKSECPYCDWVMSHA